MKPQQMMTQAVRDSVRMTVRESVEVGWTVRESVEVVVWDRVTEDG